MSQYLSALASIAVLIGGFLVFQAATDNGLAWTTESARKLAVKKSPLELPDSLLVSSDGQITDLAEFDRPILLVDFIYTQCPTICVGLGLEFRQLQSDLTALGFSDQVQLLSISFDLENDGPEQLSNYLQLYKANNDQWSAAVFANSAEKQQLLDELAVTVIPDEQVGFVHNTGIYFIQQGKVVEIFEFQDREQILQKLTDILG